jgi:predicted TIM-barrel fold metal-dependent hydrolase
MIYDGHAYCFPDLRGKAGFDEKDQFRKHLQLGIARHFQPVWRARDRASADASGLADPDGGWDFAALEDAQFRAAGHGRFEWTADGETYVKQYMPPSVTDMDYSAESLVAEMDYAGVDMAMIHRTPYLGIGNDFTAECCRRFPDRLQGLAHVEEWLAGTDVDGSIAKLRKAIDAQGLHGVQFLPDHLPLYGQSEDWTRDEFTPFWDAVAGLGVPLFITPSYSSLATQNGAPVDALVAQLRLIDGWMERYPDVPLVLTHGLSWRMFIDGDGLDIPDAVYDAVPDSPRFSMQLLFAIFLGGVWDYPMREVRPTMERLVERVGVERLMWGTDIPMVLRFYTYRQNLEHIRICSDFLPDDQVDLIVGGNMARLMGVSQG